MLSWLFNSNSKEETLLEKFKKILVKAQTTRESNRELITYTNYLGKQATTSAWVVYEIQFMTEAINKVKKELGQTNFVTFADVERIEAQAAGHSDYSRKFALYCSELVHNNSKQVVAEYL